MIETKFFYFTLDIECKMYDLFADKITTEFSSASTTTFLYQKNCVSYKHNCKMLLEFSDSYPIKRVTIQPTKTNRSVFSLKRKCANKSTHIHNSLVKFLLIDSKKFSQ